MKIAITTDAIYPFTMGGSEIRNHEIAKRLIKKGHEVHIYGAKFWKGKNKIRIEGINIHGAHKYKSLYNKSGKRSKFQTLILAIKLFNEINKEKFDIIDNAAFTFFNNFTFKLSSIITKTPLVLTWHQYFGDYLLNYFGRIIGNITLILEYSSTKLTKYNLAVSNKIKNDLIKKGVPEKNIRVFYNGADINKINTLKIKKKEFDLIYVGRFNYQKNLKLLIKSLNILKDEFPNIRVCLIGDGEEKEKILNLIKKYNLEKNIKLTGNILDKDKVFTYLKSSKIFVLPSLLEGFPLTIIEANASGLPVITTKTEHNNTNEYIKNNVNGLLTTLEPEDFANKIKYLLKNKDKLNQMSKNSINKSKDIL
mgnify:FL=1